MSKTTITGGKDVFEKAIDAILAGATPVIHHIVSPEKGYWIILHSA